MAGETLQDEVRSFLTQHIRSVVQLETLLLLRLDRQRVWSATELSRELRIDPGWAVEELARLCELGLLECDELEGEPRYRFQPATEDLDRAVGRLRSRTRLLLWSSVCFVGMSLNNAILFCDRVVFPEVDLSLPRQLTALVGLFFLLYGLVWDSR